MNSAREERAHRLADEVGRGDPRDPEPVRDLGGDGRLAGAGRAADQEDDRQVELLQRRGSAAAGAIAWRPRSRRAPRPRAPRGGRGRPSSSPRSARSSSSRARELVRALGRDAGRDQRARHQPLRVGQPVLAAERQRLGAAPLAHARTAVLGEREQRARRGPSRDDLVVGEHDLDAARGRRLGDDVDRRRLDLDDVDLGVDARRARARSASRSARLRET